MPIMFNMLLAQAGISPEKVILIRHQDNRTDKGMSPFDLWRCDRGMFEDYQSTQALRDRSKFSRAPKWASFVGVPDGKTMFVGMYDAVYQGVLDHDMPCPWMHNVTTPAGSSDFYDLKVDDTFQEYDGKLFIEWGEGTRAWVQRADHKDKVVTELRLKFQEEPFPGFLNFMQPVSKMESLPTGWKDVLRTSKGIYLLTCPKTREQYVGSATGAEGFWGRWMEYSRTSHGGDIALKSRQASDYQVSILEVAGTGMTDEQILAMESLWKKKLLSREMGLNRN